jgi:hypothetical protein
LISVALSITILSVVNQKEVDKMELEKVYFDGGGFYFEGVVIAERLDDGYLLVRDEEGEVWCNPDYIGYI